MFSPKFLPFGGLIGPNLWAADLSYSGHAQKRSLSCGQDKFLCVLDGCFYISLFPSKIKKTRLAFVTIIFGRKSRLVKRERVCHMGNWWEHGKKRASK